MNKIITDQSDWDELLDFISDKQLTPVIGREIYKFEKDGNLIPIDDYLAEQILLANQVTSQNNLSLTQAVHYLQANKHLKPMDITRKLKSMVKEINFEFPLLEEFLSVSDFNYYINTAVYNNVFEQKLNKIKNQTATSINFSINEPFSDCEELERLQAPFVFNVFGSLLNTVDPALSEEDMLEYTGAFREKMKNAGNIVNALKNKNLLFIGCSFPDWMVRFVLRLLTNEPMQEWGNKRSIIVVNDNNELGKPQYEFLRNYDVITYEANTVDFIKELSAQWKQRNPMTVKGKKVFLSYTTKDRDAVENLKKSIEGINNVSCWYDNREIAPGDDFKTVIAKNIKEADLFIPLISENSLLHKDGYVQLEWFTADNVNTFRKIDGNPAKYLMPVVIDDTNPYDTNVPRYFSELSIGKVPGGIPGQEFINQLSQTLNLIN